MKVALLIVPLLQSSLHSTAKKVVLFPFFQTSHISSFVKVAGALSDLEHEVWVCVPQFTYNRKILNTDKIKVIPYGHKLEDFDADFFRKDSRKLLGRLSFTFTTSDKQASIHE
jgi:hypothetical protein